MLKELLSNSDNVSSNRTITIITFAFMLGVMVLGLVFKLDIEILKVVLEYSFYLFVASISLKSVEKVAARLKGKD